MNSEKVRYQLSRKLKILREICARLPVAVPINGADAVPQKSTGLWILVQYIQYPVDFQ